MRFAWAVLVAVAVLAACMSSQPHTAGLPGQPAAVHNSRNALDWAAAYEGVLPSLLENHHWSLVSATDGLGRRMDALFPAPGQPLSLAFTGDRLVVSGGCNRMNASFQVDAERQLKVGRFAATMMACDAPRMNADATLSALLSEPVRIDLLSVQAPEPRMRWVAASGQTLVLSGQAKPESLYGNPTRVFMEVAAHRVACRNPLNGETLCLQVRERRYDAQGLATLPHGAWRPLFEAIAGYTHRAGERNVLRLKQFQRDPAPAGQPARIFVLDLVIEVESVKP